MKRTGRNRIVRNALIAAGNSGDTSLIPLITPLLDDASPLVRAMAVWAVRRLLKEPDVARLRKHHEPHETDADVLAEWTRDVEGCAA